MASKTYTTTSGREYQVSGQLAWPAKGPAFFPADLWGADTAQARGELVDGTIPATDYRVRGAGREWLEVYEYLQRS